MPGMGSNHFEVFERTDGRWQWRFVYANGEVANDDYGSAADARRGVNDLLHALGIGHDYADVDVVVIPRA